MKDKAKRFFLEKKELLIFIGVVILVFTAVFTISSLAMKNEAREVGKDIDDTSIIPSTDIIEPTQTDILKAPVLFSLPCSGKEEVVRTYFDKSLSVAELEKAIIQGGSYTKTSSGIGYAMEDNSVFDVNAIYDGVVTEVLVDDLKGTTVTIDHSNGIVSVYSSLANVTVKKGDTVKVGEVFAKASTSVDDISLGVHVFLEVLINDEYVNPTTVYGKKLDELVNIK